MNSCTGRALIGVFLRSCLFAAVMAAMVVAASMAFADSVIGDFEGVTDGWGSGPGSPTLSSVLSPGVTLHTHSLKSVNPQGSFWGPSTQNLMTSNLAAIQSATTLKFDLTLIGTQISGDGTAFSGFAQSNALSISLFSNPGGSLPTGVNAFIQKSFAAGIATDSSGHGAQWAGADGTRTIAWDLTQFTLTDPTTSTVKTVGKFLTDHPDTNFAAINFVEQFANGTTTTPGAFYFDNVVLAVPEPTSLLLAGLAIPALLVKARRRR